MPKSNFGVFLDVFGVSTQQAAVGIGADATLISRWRNGQRRLVAGRKWSKAIVDYAFLLDRDNNPKLMPKMMEVFYTVDDASDTEEIRALFERWLCTKTQFSDAYVSRRSLILHELFSTPREQSADASVATEHRQETAKGIKAIHKSILALEDFIAAMEPSTIQFVCPFGLEIITGDLVFSKAVMEMLMRLFACGHRMQVVIRTDFRVSDVSAFAGEWLFAHLLGFVKSFYYDDFSKTDSMQITAIISDKIAMRITADEIKDLTGTFLFDGVSIAEIRKQIDYFFDLSSQRFHYSFFDNPSDYLRKTNLEISGSCYLFSKLPHFGVAGQELLDLTNLTDDEKLIMKEQFFPLLNSTEQLAQSATVYNIFCIEEIEEALEKPRHIVPELSEMLGRRVYIKTQAFVDILIRLRGLTELPNYNLCFLTEEQFDRINLHLAVWGSSVVIGWIPGGISTVCRDFYNVGSLNGFASKVWGSVPALIKTTGAARKRLDGWLKRAALFGYDVKK